MGNKGTLRLCEKFGHRWSLYNKMLFMWGRRERKCFRCGKVEIE